MNLPTKGINVKLAMKWLLGRMFEGSAEPVPFAYNDDPDHRGGGSENMKLLYAACGWIGGAPAGRERLVRWYKTEQGHGGGEPLTVSHCQLHIGGHGAIALRADIMSDAELLDRSLNWLRIEYALLSACEVDGEPWTPGARGVHKGKVVAENPTRGKFLKVVRNGKVPGKLNQYDLGAWCVARLPADARSIIAKPLVVMPKIQGGFMAARFADGRFWAALPNLPMKEGGVRAAGYDGNEKWVDREYAIDRIASYHGTATDAIVLDNKEV